MLNIMRAEQNGGHFGEDSSKYNFLKERIRSLIAFNSLRPSDAYMRQ